MCQAKQIQQRGRLYLAEYGLQITFYLLDSLWKETETLILCFEECYNQIPHVQTNLSVYEDISIALKEYKVQTNWHLTADCGIVDKNIWAIIQRGHKSVQSTLRKSEIIPSAVKEWNADLTKNCNWGKIKTNHLGHTVGVDSASGVIPVLHRIIHCIIHCIIHRIIHRIIHCIIYRIIHRIIHCMIHRIIHRIIHGIIHRIIHNIIYSSVGCAFLRCVHSVLKRMMETHIAVLWGNPTVLTRSDGTVDG